MDERAWFADRRDQIVPASRRQMAALAAGSRHVSGNWIETAKVVKQPRIDTVLFQSGANSGEVEDGRSGKGAGGCHGSSIDCRPDLRASSRGCSALATWNIKRASQSRPWMRLPTPPRLRRDSPKRPMGAKAVRRI